MECVGYRHRNQYLLSAGPNELAKYDYPTGSYACVGRIVAA